MMRPDFTFNTTKAVGGVLVLILIGTVVFWIQQAGWADLDALEARVNELGAWGLIIFGVIYLALSMLGISKTAMTILAGTLFNFMEALIITVLASTVAAVLGFYLARHFKRFIKINIINARRQRDKTKLQTAIEKIDSGASRHGFSTIAILRLSMVPLMFISYGAGLVRTLRVRDFFWAVFLTNIYMNFIYILVGDSLTRSLPMFAVAIIVLIVSMQIPKLLSKYMPDKS